MNNDFIQRLKQLLEHYELSSSQFADQIGVQRSSLSHLISGRNRPSLDFVLKVIAEFPEVNLYWLLNGTGSLTTLANENTSPPPLSTMITKKSKKKVVERIVLFYDDGTFETYNPME